MTLTIPDVSQYNLVPLDGAKVVIIRASIPEGGTTQPDKMYGLRSLWCKQHNVPYIAYHYLKKGNVKEEADKCVSIVGTDVPIMVDCEQFNVSVSECLTFAHEARGKGGNVRLIYFPKWYWTSVGKPDLRPLALAQLLLVASDYSIGMNDPRRFLPYAPGQPMPFISQYTDKQVWNGAHVDFNICRAVDNVPQLMSILNGDTVDPDTLALIKDTHRLMSNVEYLLSLRAFGLQAPYNPRRIDFGHGAGVDVPTHLSPDWYPATPPATP